MVDKCLSSDTTAEPETAPSPYEKSGRRSLEIVKLSGLSTRSLVQGWTSSTKVGEVATVVAQRLPGIGDASQLVAHYAAWW